MSYSTTRFVETLVKCDLCNDMKREPKEYDAVVYLLGWTEFYSGDLTVLVCATCLGKLVESRNSFKKD